MSVHVMALVYKARLGCPLRKAVALKLADCADDDGGNIWPSVATIAEQAEISERSVQGKLKELVAAGLIEVASPGGGRHKTTSYRFTMGALYDLAAGRLNWSDLARNGAPDAPFTDDGKGAPHAPFADGNPAAGAQNPAAGAQNPAPPAPEPSGTIKNYDAAPRARELAELADKLTEAGGKGLADPVKAPGLMSLVIPEMWLDQGCDLDRDVLPTVAALCKARLARNRAPIKGWDYFTEAITEARAKRLAGLPTIDLNTERHHDHDRPRKSPIMSAFDRLEARLRSVG